MSGIDTPEKAGQGGEKVSVPWVGETEEGERALRVELGADHWFRDLHKVWVVGEKRGAGSTSPLRFA